MTSGRAGSVVARGDRSDSQGPMGSCRPTASAANASTEGKRRVFEEFSRGVEPEARRDPIGSLRVSLESNLPAPKPEA